MSKGSGADRYRRSWPQRLLLTANVIAIVGCLLTAAVVVYARNVVSNTKRTTILAQEGWVPSPDVPPGDPVNFLIVGSDDTEGLPADDPLVIQREKAGITGIRSDVIMIVRIDPKASSARVLSLPRDLLVNIPGQGRNKINSTMNFGGDRSPSKLIETIKSEFDININHYVEVNFASFKNIIDVIGGVDIYISHPLRDGSTGLDQPEAGCRHLDTNQALAYARSRHLQWKNHADKWISDPTADLGRIKRQKDFIRRVIAQAIRKGARNPATLNRLIQKTQGKIQLDSDTTVQDLLDLGRAFDSFNPGELETSDLPVYDDYVSGMAVVRPIEKLAEPVLAAFRGTGAAGPADDINVNDVSVRVLNGTTVDQAAAVASDKLEGIGFRVRSPNSTLPVTTTEIRFRAAADLAAARFVARYLDAEPKIIQDTSASEITIVLGPDFRSVLETPKAASSMSQTTVVATSTTAIPGVSTTVDSTTTTSTTVPQTTTTLDERGDPNRRASYVPGAQPDGVSC